MSAADDAPSERHHGTGSRWPIFVLLVTLAPVAIWLAARRGAADKASGPDPEAIPTPNSAPILPPPPPCIHEVCSERPTALQCVYAPGGHYCERYQIERERHCDCDTWGPAPSVDGGAQ